MPGQMLGIGIVPSFSLNQLVIMALCCPSQGKGHKALWGRLKIRWCKQKQQEC